MTFRAYIYERNEKYTKLTRLIIKVSLNIITRTTIIAALNNNN